jgi:hypothetical protein
MKHRRAPDPYAVEPMPPEVDRAARELLGSIVDSGRGGARRARGAISRAIDRLLDRIAVSVVDDPLDTRDAHSAKRRVDEITANVGNAAAVVGAPWVMKTAMRVVRRGRFMPSAAVIAATASTFAAIVAGAQHLRVISSLLVHRLRADGHRVDPAFVRRVAVGLYLDPAAGTDAVRPNRLAGVRLATDWATHAVPFVRGRRTAARVLRTVDAVAALPLHDAVARFERERAIDLTEAARSD